MEPLVDFTPEALEEQMNVSEVEEFTEDVNYDKFLVLSKKELNDFCRIVEPLTKQAVDDYGKCAYIHAQEDGTVKLSYINTPYRVEQIVSNRSGKMVKDFAVSIAVLKRLVLQAFSSIILVEKDDEINIALCEDLLYLETKPLLSEYYPTERIDTEDSIDIEISKFIFKKVTSLLSLTERASEKVMVVKDGNINFNTAVFNAKVKSPFSGNQSFVLYKQVADVISILVDTTKSNLKYTIKDSIIVIEKEGVYIEAQIGSSDKVNEFSSPTANIVLGFDAQVKIINDNLYRILSVVKNLEYLSDIVTLTFDNENISMIINSKNQSKQSVYKFRIVEGQPEEQGSLKITIDVLKLFLSLAGVDCKYSFTENGLGIEVQNGKFLIRKS